MRELTAKELNAVMFQNDKSIGEVCFITIHSNLNVLLQIERYIVDSLFVSRSSDDHQIDDYPSDV